MCLHKYELSLYSAIDLEKKSLLAVRIKEFVLLHQNLCWFQLFNLWSIARC